MSARYGRCRALRIAAWLEPRVSLQISRKQQWRDLDSRTRGLPRRGQRRRGRELHNGWLGPDDILIL